MASTARDFEDLLAEAEAAPVDGWDFSWLAGRAEEERPPWGYARLLAARLGTVDTALDLDTGQSVMELIDTVAARTEAALVVITHDPAIAARSRDHYRLEAGVLTRATDASASAASESRRRLAAAEPTS